MPIFYDNKANLIISEDEHFYESLNESGVYYPSVTTKLNAYPKGYGYLEWVKSNGFNSEIILQRAADLGSEVHNGIDEFNKRGKIRQISEDFTKELYSWQSWKMINRYMDFYNRYNPENIVHEFKLVSSSWKTGGTVDNISMINGNRWLIDYKTGNNIWVTSFIQISVYKAIWEELNPAYKIDKIGILHLNANTRSEGKNGKIQGKRWQLIEPPKEFKHYINLWKYTSALWDEENPNAKPKRVEYPVEFLKEQKVNISIIKEQLSLLNNADELKKYWNEDFEGNEEIKILFNERLKEIKTNE